MRLLVAALFFFSCLIVNGQDYVEDSPVYMADKVYQPNIKTVLLRPYSDPFGLPIIKFGGADRLRLDFDDMSPDFSNYNYTLIHCTYDWQPSDLLKAEYLEGLQSYFLQDYEFSINTYVPYTHYTLTIPNNDIRITKSGNYVLVVYQNNDPQDVILTRRFMVVEEEVNIAGEVVRATRLEERDTHQQLNFTLTHTGYEIPNPFMDLHVNVIQNGRWDNARMGIKPKFVKNNQLEYNFDGENTFYGGNEFRNFDTKQLTELTLNTRKSVLDSNYTIYLVPEFPRNANTYSFNEDINGRFIIRRLNSTDPATEADYAWMDFFLKTPEYPDGDVYVFGQLSDWQVRPDCRLSYDPQTRAYRGKILLKQGYYNYQYVFLPHSSRIADETEIEGSHWEATNEYTILVYHREIGIRYDRLIGITRFYERPRRQ